MNNMTQAQKALTALLTILPRLTVNDLEAVGLDKCLSEIRDALKEHADFKNPPKPEQ